MKSVTKPRDIIQNINVSYKRNVKDKINVSIKWNVKVKRNVSDKRYVRHKQEFMDSNVRREEREQSHVIVLRRSLIWPGNEELTAGLLGAVHGKTFLPWVQGREGHADCWTGWKDRKRREDAREFSDLTQGEKDFFTLWNQFLEREVYNTFRIWKPVGRLCKAW